MDKEEQIDMSGFAAELQQAFDSAQEKEATLMAEASEKVESKQEEVTTPPEEKQEKIEELKEEKKEEKAESKEEEFPLVPKEWTVEEKEEFENILANPDLKKSAELMINRYDNLKKGFYKKADELAQTKKQMSEWNDIFDPYKDALKQRGYTPTDYVNRLLSVDRQLAHDPTTVIKQLMEAYKVTPEKLGINNGVDDYEENDKIARLEQEIKQLRDTVRTDKEDAGRQQQDAHARAIREFKFAIDESGEPKYPLFEEVKEEMAILLKKVDSAKDPLAALEEAYFKSPTVKEKLAEANKEKHKQDELEAARKKAALAKKAGRAVKSGNATAATATQTKDLSKLLTEEFRAAGFM